MDLEAVHISGWNSNCNRQNFSCPLARCPACHSGFTAGWHEGLEEKASQGSEAGLMLRPQLVEPEINQGYWDQNCLGALWLSVPRVFNLTGVGSFSPHEDYARSDQAQNSWPANAATQEPPADTSAHLLTKHFSSMMSTWDTLSQCTSFSFCDTKAFFLLKRGSLWFPRSHTGLLHYMELQFYQMELLGHSFMPGRAGVMLWETDLDLRKQGKRVRRGQSTAERTTMDCQRKHISFSFQQFCTTDVSRSQRNAQLSKSYWFLFLFRI